MAKKTEIEGYSVIVFVPVGTFTNSRRWKLNEEEAKDMADTIKQDIINKLSGRGFCTVDVEEQVARTCESCGAPWTEKGADYNGNCCDADEAAEEQRKGATA